MATNARKTAAKKKPARRARGKTLKPAAQKRGLAAEQILLPVETPALAEVIGHVRTAGGVPVGAYLEPLSGRPLLLAALPFAAIEPTPFQRDLSPTHAQKLAKAIESTDAFLDPLIVVRGHEGGFWTPNGRHRLAAAKVLGLNQVMALISPDESLSYRILALNTEKAHNLKDRALEVIRMARSLAKREPAKKESAFASQFESSELLTLGTVYEKNARFGGGAYHSFLRKVDRFSERTLAVSLRERGDWGARLLEIDAQVKKIIEALQKRGMTSPYLRAYVVARINPVRFHKANKGDTRPAMPIAQALTRMAAAARGFKLEKVSMGDLAFVAAGAEAAE